MYYAGTGKTTTARKMGQVFFDMGFISSVEVVECSATDLVGEYIGHTGPKTKAIFDKALGRVLFVDEAYRLGEGRFSQEAVDEIVGLVTQDRYRGRMVIVLAGYDREMNELLSVNSGLASRFPEEIVFNNLSPVECLNVLQRKLAKESVNLDVIETSFHAQALYMLGQLSSLASWGNARDLETLANQMIRHVFTNISPDETSTERLVISGKDVLSHIRSMLISQKQRLSQVPLRRHEPSDHLTAQQGPPEPPSISSTSHSLHTARASPPPTEEEEVRKPQTAN